MKTTDDIQDLSSGDMQKIDFFAGLPRDQLLYLMRNTSVEPAARKQNIFLEGDPADFLVLIVDGFYKLSKECEQSSRRVTLDFVGAGEMVAGLLMVDPHSKFVGTLETLQAGHVLKIPRATYADFWSGNPEILRRLQQANLSRMRSLHLLREAGAFPLEKKLAWVVVKYFKKLSNSQGLVEVKFSRKDLSELVGATTESVIRVLSHWKDEKLVIVRDDAEYFDAELLESRFFARPLPGPL